MGLKQWREIIYLKALSIAIYGLQFYFGQNESLKDSLTALLMRGNCAIYGAPLSLDLNNKWICSQIGVKTLRKLIIKIALKNIHKVLITQQLPEIYRMIVFPRFFHKAAEIKVKDAPRTIQGRKSIIYISIKQFNQLHHPLKYCHLKTFITMIAKRKIQEVPDN